MIRKALTTFTLLAVLLVSLAACSSGGNNGSSSPADNSGSGSGGSADAEKVTIKMMHLWPDGSNSSQNKLVKQIIMEYEEANPGVTIKTEVLENEQYKNKLKVLSASNSLPDVGFTWAAGFLEPYVKGNLFAPLDDLLEGDLNGQFVAGTTEAYAIDGKTYALPVELNIVPVFYNKAIFEKHNLEAPKTYEEFEHVVKTLRENGVTPVALGAKDAWTGSFWYMYLADRLGGPDLLDESIANQTFQDPKLIEAAKLAQELVDMDAFVKGFNGLSNEEAKSEFMNEQAAMYAMGTWEVPNYTTAEDVDQAFKDKIGFFKFPVMEGGEGSLNNWVGGPGVGLFVAENSPVKEQAKDFVSFFVQKWGEKSVTEAGIFPATKVDTSAIDLPPMFIDLLNELNNADKVTLYVDVQMKPVASEEHHNQIQALFGKAVTPEEFAKKHEEVLKAGK
ncbi:extracellular solute-binding protein [Paenibacillus tarimensis]|uniref:extracellular solute-binding protein n=1 Tax=Paenibacillus tarimensis TaxID=416012 RepID=UPI001F448E41|nr:extracellular solute-binding protein [Paenibacillus tarimensis]MCF2945208.1 extracellular solute-binding protein [Paenibacillus tarimensis]